MRLNSKKDYQRKLAWNLVGAVLPSITGLLSIPWIVSALGNERTGLLLLVWSLIGYASILDFGISRGLTLKVAEYNAAGQFEKVTKVSWTGLITLFIFGVCLSLVTLNLVDSASSKWLNVSPPNVKDFAYCLYISAISLPIIVLCAAFRGILEGLNDFELSNKIKIPLGIWTFLCPAIVLPFSDKLSDIVIALVVGRIFAFTAYVLFCKKFLPFSAATIDITELKNILLFSGWITVSNVISPLMATLDKYLVASFVAAKSVAFYAVPSEILNRILVVPHAISGVLFTSLVEKHSLKQNVVSVIRINYQIVFLVITAPLFVTVIFGKFFLEKWINLDFANQAYSSLAIVTIGLHANAIAHIPSTALQSRGLSRTTALNHCIELPFFLIVFFLLYKDFGILAAATAWSLRAIADFFLLSFQLRKTGDLGQGSEADHLLIAESVIVSLLTLCFLLSDEIYLQILTAVLSMTFLYFFSSPDEKRMVSLFLRMPVSP